MAPQPSQSFYKHHPKTCDRHDYWGQVRRTLGGKPVPDAQIDLIVDTMAHNLDLRSEDRLLDLCCGNGALSVRWFERCAGGLGVDFSPPLIEVASEDFAQPPQWDFLLADVVEFAQNSSAHGVFNKAIVYGSVQYLTRVQLLRLLCGVRLGHPEVVRFVLGNVPDRDREPVFRGGRPEQPLDDPDSAIGVWWRADDLGQLAAEAGWALEVARMPEAFYARHYRFDAILRPA